MKETTTATTIEKFYLDYTLGMLHAAALVVASMGSAILLLKLI